MPWWRIPAWWVRTDWQTPAGLSVSAGVPVSAGGYGLHIQGIVVGPGGGFLALTYGEFTKELVIRAQYVITADRMPTLPPQGIRISLESEPAFGSTAAKVILGGLLTARTLGCTILNDCPRSICTLGRRDSVKNAQTGNLISGYGGPTSSPYATSFNEVHLLPNLLTIAEALEGKPQPPYHPNVNETIDLSLAAETALTFPIYFDIHRPMDLLFETELRFIMNLRGPSWFAYGLNLPIIGPIGVPVELSITEPILYFFL
jgi:hypothetical protein